MAADWRDWDLDDIPEWQGSAQHVLLALVFSALMLAATFFFLLPALQQVDLAESEEKMLRAQFRTKAEQVAALPNVDEQTQALKQFYRQLTQQLPAEDELALLLAGINDTGLQYRLTFEKLNWKPSVQVGWLHQVPLDIELTGKYADIGQFSAALARLPRIVALQDFTLTRESPHAEPLHLKVSAHTYRFEREQEGP